MRQKILIAIVLGLCLYSCGAGESKPAPRPRLTDSEVLEYREAVQKINPYIELKDSAYNLNITLPEAEKLGVSEKYYNYILQDLEYTNHTIREEYNKQGQPIELQRASTEPR